SVGFTLAEGSSLGLAVKKRTAPTPTPTTATPVKTSLTSAIDLIELTLSSVQFGLQFFSASLNLPFATRPVMRAPTAAAPPTPSATYAGPRLGEPTGGGGVGGIAEAVGGGGAVGVGAE